MGTAESVLVIIGSVVAVLSALAAFARVVWKFAQDLRDNKKATVANTKAIDELKVSVNGLVHRLDYPVSYQRPPW